MPVITWLCNRVVRFQSRPTNWPLLAIESLVAPGGTPYNGLYGEAPPERGTFFRLQVYTGVMGSWRKSTQVHARPVQTESQVDPGFH